ncbi:MAG: rhodanese-like domain-containing protein [Verrucomicrobiae bacterium]|nr:rhodanese-like domain-containing protein [Verrucomicrobiae bacterium]MCP5541649.1 rhodanese-like domain-containing protein [Akkermansiaceae bacterium]MCP5549294.1 rhodanese-like domain-containing protein [Akkermansiaceae bacterium]
MKSQLSTSTLAALAIALSACEQQPAPETKPADSATSAAPASAAEVKHVDAKGAAELLKTVTVLDVRTPEEFSLSHIEGAKNIDFKNASFESEIAKLPKDAPYLVHCRSGGRSTSSLETFKKLGFTHIYHLDGGLMGWEDAGQPLTH